MSVRLHHLALLLLLGGLLLSPPLQADDPLAPGELGVVALSDIAGIGILDPGTHQLHGPFLHDGSLGTAGGGVFDVVVTPDGQTAIISNFGDATVHFVDISSPLQPRVYASLDIGFFAEDLALSPDGQWLLVADGGFSPRIASIHVPSTRHIQTCNTESIGYANSVAIAPDGQTVLAADYFNGAVLVLLLDPQTGLLTCMESLPIQEFLSPVPAANALPVLDTKGSVVSTAFRPVNIIISPDGRTALALNASRSGGATALPRDSVPDYIRGASPALLRIDGPGQVVFTHLVSLPSTVGNNQSGVFSPDGRSAYLYCTHFDPVTEEPGPMEIVELEATGPGEMQKTGRNIVLQRGVVSSALFGVDTLAMAPGSSRFLYASNPSLSGGTRNLSVVDLNWFEQVALIDTPAIPAGLAFATTAGGGGADLAVGLNLSAASVPVNTELTATVTVTNPGPGTASNIVISSPVHRTWPLVSYQASHGGYEPGCHRWVIPSLPAGATATLTLTVTAPSALTDVLEARLLSLDGYDPNPSNDVGTAPITITAAGAH